MSDPRAVECSAAIVAAFARYNAEYRAITRRAPERFENRDWAGSQADVVERLELYATMVNQTVADSTEASRRFRAGHRVVGGDQE